MSPLQLLALVAMSSPKDRPPIEPSEFYGIRDHVEKMLDDPTAEMKLLLKTIVGSEWPGPDVISFRNFVIEECRLECLCERNCDLFSEQFEEVKKAKAYIDHYKTLTHMKSDPEILRRLEICRKVVIGSIKCEPWNVPAIEGAAT